jgi:hypothetical protein
MESRQRGQTGDHPIKQPHRIIRDDFHELPQFPEREPMAVILTQPKPQRLESPTITGRLQYTIAKSHRTISHAIGDAFKLVVHCNEFQQLPKAARLLEH